MDSPLSTLELQEPPAGEFHAARLLGSVGLERRVESGESSGLVGAGGVFRCIVADPPWWYNRSWDGSSGRGSRGLVLDGKSVEMPYRQMKLAEIKALPVGKLAAENCDLYLWVTQKYLPDSFGVLAAWGFRYCQTLTWCKTPRGTGQGGLYCPTTEFIVLGRKGAMPQKQRQDTTWWNITRPHNAHSAKPEFFTDVIEAMSEGPRLELFARRQRLGWQTWGNEALCHVSLGGGGAELVTKDSDGTAEKKERSGVGRK